MSQTCTTCGIRTTATATRSSGLHVPVCESCTALKSLQEDRRSDLRSGTILAVGAGLSGLSFVALAVLARGPSALVDWTAFVESIEAVLNRNAMSDLFEAVALLAVAATVALENTIREVARRSAPTAEPSGQAGERFILRRAVWVLAGVVIVLGGCAGVLGVTCLVRVSWNMQLIGLVYVLLAIWLWNEVRRLLSAVDHDERQHYESVQVLHRLARRITAIEQHSIRTGTSWASAYPVGLTLLTTGAVLILNPQNLQLQLLAGGGVIALWALTLVVLLMLGDCYLQEQRVLTIHSSLLSVLIVSMNVLASTVLLIRAAQGLTPVATAFIAILALSATVASAVIALGACGKGPAASISALLLWRLRRLEVRLRRTAPGTASSTLEPRKAIG
jgi:hypothetical protein